MQLTAHKTVTQFMRYVHTEDDPVRAAAEAVSSRRLAVLSGQRANKQPGHEVAAAQPADPLETPVGEPADFDNGRYNSNT
jgi:hypothetical protein